MEPKKTCKPHLRSTLAFETQGLKAVGVSTPKKFRLSGGLFHRCENSRDGVCADWSSVLVALVRAAVPGSMELVDRGSYEGQTVPSEITQTRKWFWAKPGKSKGHWFRDKEQAEPLLEEAASGLDNMDDTCQAGARVRAVRATAATRIPSGIAVKTGKPREASQLVPKETARLVRFSSSRTAVHIWTPESRAQF